MVLTSSDAAPWGINTPGFFAIDNFNDQTVSLNETTEELALSIYPNPTLGDLSINLADNVSSIKIFDVTGKIVAEENNLLAGNHQLNLTKLKAGVYFLKVSANQETKVVRLIKQ